MAGLGDPVEIEIGEDPVGDQDVRDDKGNLLSIEHDDGSITVSLNGGPLEGPNYDNENPQGWFDNLAEKIPESELLRIADELLRGIDDDIASRRDWMESRAQGIRLLGLKLEMPGGQGDGDGAPLEGMSKVRHPLLLEAVLRFQANARSELLPTDGPVKIRNDDNNATLQEDQLANALERDLNHYLTSTAAEYYPDTDRMLLMLGFGGTAFKKVYFCPVRQRPVSETIDANDLIVNNDATDLTNAKRITHRISMRPSVVKRMQILNVYRDIMLSEPIGSIKDSVQIEKKEQEGISLSTSNPLDRDRDIYECYCELDIAGYEHKHNGKASGLEVPYRVTIDESSRQIFSIVRNYDEETKSLPVARKSFVKYTFVPGFGFYDIGLLHILGNTTSAITAAWREMLDNGMYANFPGFLISKSASRQSSNMFRIPPGGAAQIETNGQPIQNSVMSVPYNTQGMMALQSLVSDMEQTGQRIGGTSEMMVGEGRADAPVGTTLALIDQASKVLNSVHKRLHSSQAEEFQMLCAVFQEHPESFWERNYKMTTKWDQATLLKALADYDLCPQADPNTASHSQRVMKVMGLKQLQSANPGLYDAVAIDTAALQTMGWSNPQQFFSNPATAQPDPRILEGEAKAETAKTQADARMIDAQAKMAETQAKMEGGLFAREAPQEKMHEDSPSDMLLAQANMSDSQTKQQELKIRTGQLALQEANKAKDRESKERIAAMGLEKELLLHPDSGLSGGVKNSVEHTITNLSPEG